MASSSGKTWRPVALAAVFVALSSWGHAQTAAVPVPSPAGPGAGRQPTQGAVAPTPAAPRFASDIQAFLDADKATPPPTDAILFVGSSIFRLWNSLVEQMAPLPVFNRAFGGSRTDEVLFYMDRIVLPYRPRIIVYYCGSNDVNANRTAEDIAGNVKAFARRVHEALPRTTIYFVSVNRAPQKRDRWDVVDGVNRAMQAYAETAPNLEFIDVNPALFDGRGEPRLDLYVPDRLHLTPAAYEAFTAIIKPVLERAWATRQRN